MDDARKIKSQISGNITPAGQPRCVTHRDKRASDNFRINTTAVNAVCLAPSGRGYRCEMARSQKPRDIPEGAKLIAANRRARRDYEVIQTLEVGLVLQGSEVKSLREGKAQLAESWARVDAGELWLHNLHIATYSHATDTFVPEPDRVRKLLAHRREIRMIGDRVQRGRFALIPLALYFAGSRAKLTLAVARGRTRADRRQEISQREADLEAARAMARGLRRHRAGSL